MLVTGDNSMVSVSFANAQTKWDSADTDTILPLSELGSHNEGKLGSVLAVFCSRSTIIANASFWCLRRD